MATILAHIQIKPGSELEFERAARELYSATHGNEKNVRRYEYWRGEEPGKYYTLLAFDDFNSFIVHQSSDHHEGAGPALGNSIAGIRLEWVDPIVGAAPLPPTNHQECPADANELMKRYHGMYAPTVAGWWAPLRG